MRLAELPGPAWVPFGQQWNWPCLCHISSTVCLSPTALTATATATVITTYSNSNSQLCCMQKTMHEQPTALYATGKAQQSAYASREISSERAGHALHRLMQGLGGSCCMHMHLTESQHSQGCETSIGQASRSSTHCFSPLGTGTVAAWRCCWALDCVFCSPWRDGCTGRK